VTQFDASVAPGRALLRDALVLTVGMAVANGSNYAFNLVMAGLLGPEAYGALGALLALVLLGSVPGLALQAVVARRTALGQGGAATPWPEARLLVAWVGAALGLLVVLAAPALVAFLHLGSALPVLWLALALAPTPLLFAVQGLLQGRERFGALAVVLVGGALGKLATGLVLVAAGLGVPGAMAGVAAGGALAALVGLRLAGRPLPPAPIDRDPSDRGTPSGFPGPLRDRRTAGRAAALDLGREVGTATVGLLGLFLLANLDMLLARHYLDPAASGSYALGAVVAKIAFWAPQFVVTMVFPRLVHAADPRRLLGGAALLVAGFGGLLAAGLAAAAALGTTVPVLGGGYAAAGPLLPLFALLGTGLALTQLLLFEGIAARDRRMNWTVAGALAAETALVAVLHDSAGQIAAVTLAVVAAVAVTGWLLLRLRLLRHPVPSTVRPEESGA
jgi:O-antigen/teichoic acid export membrane protein